MKTDILLLTPPFTQLNTPYPATAYLKGFLNTRNCRTFQMDLGIEVILTLFSKKELEILFELACRNNTILSDNAKRIYALRKDYLNTIKDVISFLQGENQGIARQICGGDFLPQASRFDQNDDLDWAFGVMGFQDKAKHLATLYLEDLSDFIKECIDEHFGFSRYAERLGISANSFDEIHKHLQNRTSYLDDLGLDILDQKLNCLQPTLVGISVPFPGNLYAAFRCAQWIKKNHPEIKIAMGGGFPNTELRSLSDVRVFDFFDYITLDDGELPLEILASNILNPSPENPDFNRFKRTLLKENGKVAYNNLSLKSDYKQTELGTPDYSDLPIDKYLSVIEVTNPMHSLWSDGRWMKLTMAHGCYWGKCTFCDGSLNYIKNFEPNAAKILVDRMEQIIEQTGEKGFHFVDEAAPPTLMSALAREILRRNLTVTWWTNIRFEKSFTKDLCLLLKASGCIAVSGGLEVASDRLLALINKGVTVEQVARVTDHFTEAGIMVHAYLMYGYPTQTVQETVDSLEMVRQMFELGIIQSGFWHQFALTTHSPVGLHPDQYGLSPDYKEVSFANNDIQFVDKTGIDHGKFSFGLKKSLLNFMNGIGFEMPLQDWFEFKIPKTSIKKDFLQKHLTFQETAITKPSDKMIWLGSSPIVTPTSKIKKGENRQMLVLTFHEKTERFRLSLEKDQGTWLLKTLEKLRINEKSPLTFSDLKSDFEKELEDFELFWYSKAITTLREHGLLTL
ncbi:MAG: radical SAM protein [Bacteroidales bacterium]|nr:radical SAM protein [Bacteroidales bacterium]